MRILWVKANKLLPVRSGGDIRSYHIARRLASQHEFAFLSYYDGPQDPSYEAELKDQFPSAVAICTGRRQGSTLARGIDYVWRALTQTPYAVSRFECGRVRELIRNWFEERRVDVAVCDFLDAAVNFPRNLTVTCVLFQHNVESEIWRRHALTESNPARRALYRLESKKMIAYERSTVKRFQHVIAVSEHDAQLMRGWADKSRITVVPTGVDLERFRPDSQARRLAPLVMFVGAMDWEPNIDAVEYFCREIWPHVQGGIPGARFRIVGRNPDRRVSRLASESIEVTGSVPSVVEHLREAAVVVVPLRIGGGTRLKIYEAMAAGKAVVSTSVGAEGLDVHHGRDIVLADSPLCFAETILMLWRDQNLRQKFERAAAELARQYDWAIIGDKFSHALEVISGQIPAAPENEHASIKAG